MSFMPAEEDDDFDMEDGFIDCSDIPEILHYNYGEASFPKKDAPKSVSFSAGGYATKEVERKTPSIFSSPSKRRPPLKRSSAAVTTEDLRMAIMKNNKDVVEKYLDLGLPVDEPLRSGWTALMYAAHYARPDYVQLLLQHGANTNYQCDMFTPLMCASSAATSNTQAVEDCVKALIKAGADVNARDRFHMTALMLASREGYLTVVKDLLAAGANVNLQDSKGWTALTMATQRSRAPVVVELLDSGADPNIQHSDKLTVKDLAAHLTSDDMLALLERRPVNSTAGSKQQSVAAPVTGLTSQHCLLDSGDSQARLTDLRYGELEVFLLGLDLGHLVGVFQDQLVDLQLLLTLTEQDLINAGVEQLGARKKILDAVQAVHKKDWQPSSLVSIHYNKRISCADAVAMLANSSRHVRYICSTVIYVREQLRKHPETIMLPTDRVTPGQFLRHTEDAMKNVLSLTAQVETLKSDLEKEMSQHNIDPPDLISATRHTSRVRPYHVCGATVLLACLAACAWWGRDRVLSAMAWRLKVLTGQ